MNNKCNRNAIHSDGLVISSELLLKSTPNTVDSASIFDKRSWSNWRSCIRRPDKVEIPMSSFVHLYQFFPK